MGELIYTSHYKTRILGKYTIPRTFLESGLLCELYYKPLDSRTFKYYYVVILHPGFGPFPHKLMHALTLEHMNPMYFDRFVDDVGLEYSIHMKTIRKVAIEKLIMDKKDSKKFYLTELKRRLNTSFDNTYRTFNTMNIKMIRALDYKFTNQKDILQDSYNKQMAKSVNAQVDDKKKIVSRYIRPNKNENE
jgi:hypothetical protein